MKRVILLLTAFLCFAVTGMASAAVHVNGYFRKDGTYVQPHYRSEPDHNPYNNWSYPGNTNPYTGVTSTGNTDTYLNHYYNHDSYSSNYNLYTPAPSTYYTPSFDETSSLDFSTDLDSYGSDFDSDSDSD